MTKRILIAGGGIGGLAAALACSRAGCGVHVMERGAEFAEVGAGIQLGPNVVRVLHGWGLSEALAAVAAFPARLQVRNAASGAALAELPLGPRTVQRYGAPYATVHRADLQQLLLAAVRQRDGVDLQLNAEVTGFIETSSGVSVKNRAGAPVRADALIGADGLWSRVRQQLLGDGGPRVTGHLAYRAMVRQDSLPEHLRSQQVTAWLGPKLHLIQYPVRGGDWLNVVGIVQGQAKGDVRSWDRSTEASDLRRALEGMCPALTDLVDAVPSWRLWELCDRVPMQGANQQARGLVALLGDAAHPMRPYLAQGAGMAIEDAEALGRSLTEAGEASSNTSAALARYAAERWARCARVQARSIRNGEIFHAEGVVRWGRDLSMRLLGARLLDVPWLYRH
ncbi:MAG: FAD-dependent oxidoreductase [Hylemonella sp.]|nr:FAD-dependent oxidoreductase [Hylemonella sp.]